MNRSIAALLGGLLTAGALLPTVGAYAAYAQISGKVTGWTHDSNAKISVRNESNDYDVYGNYYRSNSTSQLNINNAHAAGTVVTSGSGNGITRIRVGVSKTGPDELSAWDYN